MDIFMLKAPENNFTDQQGCKRVARSILANKNKLIWLISRESALIVPGHLETNSQRNRPNQQIALISAESGWKIKRESQLEVST